MDVSLIDTKTRLDLMDLPAKAMEAVIWRNPDQYAECFTADAVWDIRPSIQPIHGREAIRAFFLQSVNSHEWVAQGQYFTRIAEYDGTRAKLRTYLGEWGKRPDEDAVAGFGMYVDDCVLEGGVWRIAVHKIVFIYMGAPDLAHPRFMLRPDQIDYDA
jgi:hypothetical protein